MKFIGIKKMDSGKYINRYNLTYETEDGETVIIEGSVEAPEGWYWLTIEVTDVDGNINCYNTRIHAGKSTPQAEPVKAPEYTSFDISGKVNGMDSVSVTVSGTRYMLADFSRIEAGISNNTRVIGKGRAYTKENVLVVESLQAVKETLTPFSGLVDDLGTDYVIIDGHALAISDETKRYCEDIRTGDYVQVSSITNNSQQAAPFNILISGLLFSMFAGFQ